MDVKNNSQCYKSIIFYNIILLFIVSFAHTSWDSPNFITNQNPNSIKVQQRTGDILAIALNVVVLSKIIIDKDRNGFKEYGYSFASNTILTLGLKYGINRKRPDGENYSFPSGHTSFSFLGATYLQQKYGKTWGIPSFLAASFVGYSRVASKRHYVSDVLTGAVIGTLSTLYFTSPYKYKVDNITYNINAQPYFSKDHIGINFNITY